MIRQQAFWLDYGLLYAEFGGVFIVSLHGETPVFLLSFPVLPENDSRYDSNMF
jgi:hypothetical protein